MVKVGMIGLSEGNGHPFSFSAILNGYEQEFFANAGWPGILNYLNKRDKSEIATLDARVTHLWTQDSDISSRLAAACLIENIVDEYVDMIGKIDALIIARDDYEEHYSMAIPFLEKGIPVFIDKPLTLSLEELVVFKPYIESGLLMSCSGFRFCQELDSWRQSVSQFGTIKLVQASVINGWNKYGIHMVDAILSLGYSVPLYVEPVIHESHESVNLVMTDGSLCQINALGNEVVVFSLSVFGSKSVETVQIRDNFTAFRRTLFRFIEQVRTGKPSIDPSKTLLSIRTLIAGRTALDTGKRVYLKDLDI